MRCQTCVRQHRTGAPTRFALSGYLRRCEAHDGVLLPFVGRPAQRPARNARPWHANASGPARCRSWCSSSTGEPRPLFEVQPHTPRGLAEVVRTCLEKDPEKRWQSARDVRHALRLIAAPPAPPEPSIPWRSVRVWQGLAVSMAAIALGIGAWLYQPKAPGSPARFEAPVPDGVTLFDDVSVSPDGRKLGSQTLKAGCGCAISVHSTGGACQARMVPRPYLVARQPLRRLHRRRHTQPNCTWGLSTSPPRTSLVSGSWPPVCPAVWSPDGTRIAYSAGRLGDTIYEKAASGVGDGQVLLKEP